MIKLSPPTLVTPDQPNTHSGLGTTRAVAIAVLVALSIAILVLVIAIARSDDSSAAATGVEQLAHSTDTASLPSEPIVSGPTTSSTTTYARPSFALWPATDSSRYQAPSQLSHDFAFTYLGFSTPLVGRFEPMESNRGHVDVRASPGGPVTLILVQRLAEDGSWWVAGATTAAIIVDEPATGAAIGDFLHVAGEAVAPSGDLQVQIRENRTEDPLLVRDFATGGGEELQWFEGGFGWSTPGHNSGAVVFLIRDPSGQPQQATVVSVDLAPPYLGVD